MPLARRNPTPMQGLTWLKVFTIIKTLRRRPSKGSSVIKSMGQRWSVLVASVRFSRPLALPWSGDHFIKNVLP